MTRLFKKVSKKMGLPPGTLVHVGEKKEEKARITIIDYDESQFQEKEAKTIDEYISFKDKPSVTWINIDGLHELDIIEKIGQSFKIHPLVLEDIVHTGQRPKLEDFDDYMFVVLKMLSYNEKKEEVKAEQVSLILCQNLVLSFQEMQGDVFNTVRDRIRNSKGRIRKMGADYLAYALLDAIVDYYFIILEKLGEKIESLEEVLSESPSQETLQQIRDIKREMILLRKSIWPLREVISGLQKAEISLIQESTSIYLRDVYDHTIQVIDTIETYRDMVAGMHDVYISNLSFRMNEVMKVLTIIATVFIPLTFIAGIYGMNFEFMPELKWRFGYFAALFVMLIVCGGMVVYFKKKKWL